MAQFIVTQVECSHSEETLTILKPVITHHVCLRLINITVEKCESLEAPELRGLRICQMKKTQN